MLLKNPIFFHDTVPVDCREQWHKKAIDALTDCSLVFLDPDNGLLVKSVKEGSQKSVKYVIAMLKKGRFRLDAAAEL